LESKGRDDGGAAALDDETTGPRGEEGKPGLDGAEGGLLGGVDPFGEAAGGVPDAGAPPFPPPPVFKKRFAPAKPSPIWMAWPTADDIGVPEQKSICMTMGVTRLPRMSQMATMPPMTSLTGVNPVASPAAKAPALTVEPTLVSIEKPTRSTTAKPMGHARMARVC